MFGVWFISKLSVIHMHGIGIHLKYPRWSQKRWPDLRFLAIFWVCVWATCDFCVSLQLCWAEIFPYRLSIVLYFFINCNFISNIVTDKVGLDNANGCSNVLPSGWVDFFVWLWSHWNSATNAHFHHFAKGRGKLIVFLV